MRQKPYLAYFGLLLLFLIAIGVRIRDSRDQLKAILYPTQMPTSFMELKPPNIILRAGTAGRKAGLGDGDVLLAVDSHPFQGFSDLYLKIRESRVGDELLVRVRRGTSNDSAATDVAVKLPPFSATPTPWRVGVVVILNGVIMPVFCIMLGFWVAAVRIRDPLAWIVLFLMLGFACQLGNTREVTLFGYDDWFQPILIAYQASLFNGWAIAMMLFGLYFPERLIYDRRWPWAKWLVLAPLLIHLVLNTTMRIFEAKHAATAFAIDQALEPFDRLLYALGLVAISFFFFGTGAKLATTENRDAERRLSLLMMGATLALTPILFIVIKDFLLGQTRFSTTPEWIMVLVWLPVFLFPATIAYLILVQRALDVHVVVRQSVQYLLAKNTARFLEIVFMAVVIFGAAFLATAADPMNMRNHPQRILLIAEGLAGMLLVQRVAERLGRWIDRRFFREEYNAELLLSDLAEKVRTIVETRQLLETVGRRISESLHITKIALLLPQASGDFEPAYAMGYSGTPIASIPERGVMVKELQRENRLDVYPDDEASWLHRTKVSEDERRALEILQSQVLLSLSLNQKLLGIISLGPKQSEAPFSNADLRLLGSVATQTGLALENSRLAAEVAAEVAERERINRELEIAREVQERLFPHELPEFPGLDYAGTCRPALAVGGDYYDFIRLSDRELGIAVGDVSGKGIPAALMMTGLRASLRGQIIRNENNLAELMANVNKLIYEGSTSNRYATFFYAEFNVESGELNYVNAGHNPPLIIHDTDVIRLETGGPVVGLLPSFPYQQATVRLQPGDLLVAFTDGISEAMNGDDQEWGEDRLIHSIRASDGLSAGATINRILRGADEFVAGAKQHDDMTIIVARILRDFPRQDPPAGSSPAGF